MNRVTCHPITPGANLSSARLVQRRYYERAAIETLSAETGQSTVAIYQSLSRLRRALADCIRRRLRSAESEPAAFHEH